MTRYKNYKFLLPGIIALLVSYFNTLSAQDYSGTKINEYYWGTPLVKVLHDFRFKYNIPIVYDSAMVSGYKVDYLFDNTLAVTAIGIVFRDNKDLSYTIDSNNIVQVVPRELAKGNIITGDNLKYQTKPRRFDLTVTGVVKDKLSGEPLPFASLMIRENNSGTSSNVDGYFTLQHVPCDTSSFMVFYLGYYRQTFHLTPKSDLRKLIIYLDPMPTELKAVEVKGEREELMKAAEGGNMIKMAPAKIAELPSLGEKDIFRTFQLMPGIGGSNESSSGLYVRGGTPDQNLILYDGFTLYHQEHLFGMFSAFNPNAIKEVQLFKGGFESKYGGRLASVMEIIGKTGNEEKFNAGVDAGFLGINGYLEIPLNHKGSVFIAGRRSYKTFLYTKLFNSFTQNNGKPKTTVSAPAGDGPSGMRQMVEEQSPTSYFYDLNFKATYPVTRKDIISYSYFSGQDDYDNSRDLSRERGGISMEGDVTDLTTWGNWGTSLKWSRKWSEKVYSNNLISYSNYTSSKDRSSSRTFVNEDDETETFNSGTVEDNNLKDLCFKTDNECKTGLHNQLEFGAQFNNYNIRYNFVQNDTVSVLDMKNTGSLAAIYFQNRRKPLDKFMFLPGLRTSYYSNTGKLYVEPRFQASYNLTEKVKLKSSAGLFYQFANRIIREDIASGSRDIWVLSNGDNIPVSKAIHLIGGMSYENHDYLIDGEAYYKKLYGLTEYTLRFSQQFGPGQQNVDYSSLFYNGDGYTRGFDLLLQKKYGKYSGWLGYTLSETRYHFPVYGDGYFNATQDVTHEFKIVNTYKYKKWTFSATWIFGTGMAYTRPLGGYVLTLPDSTTVDVIIPGTKNAARLPNYHRLDVSAKYDLRMGDFGKGSLSFSIFNLYNRKNVWYKEFEVDETGLTETNMTLLGITPNVSLSFQIR